VSIRLTAKGADETLLDRQIAEVEAEIRRRLGPYIYGVDDQTLEGVVGELLEKQGQTLAVVESVRGGTPLLAKLTSAPQATTFFKEGIVLYTDEARERFLTRCLTPPPSLSSLTPPELARLMAQGVQRLSGTDIGLCVVGEITPPEDPASEPTAVAHVGLAVAEEETQVREFKIARTFSYIQERTALFALDMLRRHLLGRE
ncbi:MAG: hypothetical protein D6736_13980, partial [Nitrospinota bacterium]